MVKLGGGAGCGIKVRKPSGGKVLQRFQINEKANRRRFSEKY